MAITRALIIILVQEVLFDGMLVVKGILLKRRIERPVQGRDPVARVAASFYLLYVLAALALSSFRTPFASVAVMGDSAALVVGVSLLAVSLAVAAAALISMKDSWRVAALDEAGTELIQTGIYRVSRNPYVVANIVMFLGCAVLIQNLLLNLCLHLTGFQLESVKYR